MSAICSRARCHFFSLCLVPPNGDLKANWWAGRESQKPGKWMHHTVIFAVGASRKSAHLNIPIDVLMSSLFHKNVGPLGHDRGLQVSHFECD